MNKLLFLSLVFVLACGTIRLQVKSPYKSTRGSGFITYERTYDVSGGMPFWCGLSVVFYGGACWAYLIMPFPPDEKKAVRDATTDLNSQLGFTDAILETPEVKRLSWGSAETYISLDPPLVN